MRGDLAKDGRIVYGARCLWWESIDKVATKPSGLPCCPWCGGVLLEVDSEAEWWAGARRHEAEKEPGYVAFLEWLRGRCYSTINDARRAYAASKETP